MSAFCPSSGYNIVPHRLISIVFFNIGVATHVDAFRSRVTPNYNRN